MQHWLRHTLWAHPHDIMQFSLDPANYRPISLLSILSKLLEKHIQNCILKHLDEHSPISDNQWGFTRGIATTGALIFGAQ